MALWLLIKNERVGWEKKDSLISSPGSNLDLMNSNDVRPHAPIQQANSTVKATECVITVQSDETGAISWVLLSCLAKHLSDSKQQLNGRVNATCCIDLLSEYFALRRSLICHACVLTVRGRPALLIHYCVLSVNVTRVLTERSHVFS